MHLPFCSWQFLVVNVATSLCRENRYDTIMPLTRVLSLSASGQEARFSKGWTCQSPHSLLWQSYCRWHTTDAAILRWRSHWFGKTTLENMWIIFFPFEILWVTPSLSVRNLGTFLFMELIFTVLTDNTKRPGDTKMQKSMGAHDYLHDTFSQ